MALRLTPDVLETAYTFLRSTRTMASWGLPESDDVEFHIIQNRCVSGDHQYTGGRHVVRISETKHGSVTMLLYTLAHEMCHMKEVIDGARGDVKHGAAFRKYAKSVCKELGFDERAF